VIGLVYLIVSLSSSSLFCTFFPFFYFTLNLFFIVLHLFFALSVFLFILLLLLLSTERVHVAVMILPRTGEVFGSDLGPITDYPKFLVVFNSPSCKCRDGISIGPLPLPSKWFPKYHSSNMHSFEHY
jgi:hypothetical protein